MLSSAFDLDVGRCVFRLRQLARDVEKAANAPGRVEAERAYLNTRDLIERIAGARVAVAMRYHAHLFCLALGVPFVSVNYTGVDGKVARLVNRLGGAVPSLDWATLDARRIEEALRLVLDDGANRRAKLLECRDNLLKDLRSVCERALIAGSEPQP